MEHVMLTALAIEKMATPATRREVPDGKVTGLYLVLQPTGARSWALRYRANGQPKKLTLGAYPALDLATARKRAQEAVGEVAGGKDPAALKVAARAAAKAEREAETDRVERVADLFVERYAKPKTRDWRETKRMLDNEIVARWRGRRLSQITRSHVSDMLDEIVDRGAPVRANRVFAQLRKLCNWAISRGLIDRNPCQGMSAPSPETKRDRVLSDDEVRLVWRASDAIGWPFGPIVKMLLLTGGRRDEVAEMRWTELDLGALCTKAEDGKAVEIAGMRWTLPASRTKNKHAHIVPLSSAAIELLQGLPRVEGKGGFVFSTTGRTPVSGFSRAKTILDASILKLMSGDAGEPVGAPDRWTLHDLRRTVATGLQKLGVRLEVTEAVLNHVSGSRAGIVGLYQRHDYATEKRAALDAWARRLDAIVNPAPASNVIELAAARG